MKQNGFEVIFQEYSISSPVWEFSGKEWNGLEGMLIPFLFLISIPPKSGRNTQFFHGILSLFREKTNKR